MTTFESLCIARGLGSSLAKEIYIMEIYIMELQMDSIHADGCASRANSERSFCLAVAVRSKSCLQLFGLVRRDWFHVQFIPSQEIV
jgi:hypothetical protein